MPQQDAEVDSFLQHIQLDRKMQHLHLHSMTDCLYYQAYKWETDKKQKIEPSVANSETGETITIKQCVNSLKVFCW